MTWFRITLFIADITEDLPCYLEDLEGKGVETFDFSEKKLQNFLRDPDGNLIELVDANDNYFK